jgi:N-acetylmuramoyl-L-alanine amidase
LNLIRHPAIATLLTLMSLAAIAQTTAPEGQKTPPTPLPVPMNRLVIALDPAHGGVDSGSRIGDSTLEKDVTLALAFKLRSLLSARGFTVVMTRDADNPTEPNAAGTPLTLDDRAGIANHAHAVACLLLHATGSGKGLHLYSSELPPTAGVATPEPWLTAQSAWIASSRDLEQRMSSAVNRAGIPIVTSSASVRPVDSLSCPALVLELAPETEDADSINDADYQQRVALALAGSLSFWQNAAQPPLRVAAVSASPAVPEPQP